MAVGSAIVSGIGLLYSIYQDRKQRKAMEAQQRLEEERYQEEKKRLEAEAEGKTDTGLEARRKALARFGQASTRLSGPLGDTSTPQTRKKKLLGE
jgi:hypothetical protein